MGVLCLICAISVCGIFSRSVTLVWNKTCLCNETRKVTGSSQSMIRKPMITLKIWWTSLDYSTWRDVLILVNLADTWGIGYYISEVKWIMVKFLWIKVLCKLWWLYTAGIWLYCDYFIWVYLVLFVLICTVVVLYCFVMCVWVGFCNVWMFWYVLWLRFFWTWLRFFLLWLRFSHAFSSVVRQMPG